MSRLLMLSGIGPADELRMFGIPVARDLPDVGFAGRSDRDVQYLNAWLSAGFAVVATDYQGLGTPGGHPYLAAEPEAYGVLDSVRAVKGRDQIGDAVLIVGQSQGAGAAFAAAALAPSYAPDVKLRRTVTTGLPYFSRERWRPWRADATRTARRGPSSIRCCSFSSPNKPGPAVSLAGWLRAACIRSRRR